MQKTHLKNSAALSKQETSLQKGGGCEVELTEIYELYAAAVFGVIQGITGDTKTAEQVLADTFLKFNVFLKEPDLLGERLFTRLLKIARESALQAVPKKINVSGQIQSKQNIVSNSGALSKNTPGSMNNQKDSPTSSHEVLPEQKKTALHLVYINGYSLAQVAFELSMSIADVKMKIRNELNNLRGEGIK